MKNQYSQSDSTTRQTDKNRAIQSYLAPQLVVVGKASDLVQSYSYGKYSDGYSGYYWER